MAIRNFSALACVGALLLLAGCSSHTAVTVTGPFPTPLYEPLPIDVALVVTDEFKSYVGEPDKKTSIDLGIAQQLLFEQTMTGLFRELTVTASVEESAGSDLVIVPSVHEVQIAVPMDSAVNIYEVWIKYGLDVYEGNGEHLTSWFMPTYGKTPTAFMKSKSEALAQAANVALRDAGARLILDFRRIPDIHRWMKRSLAEGGEE